MDEETARGEGFIIGVVFMAVLVIVFGGFGVASGFVMSVLEVM